ncbi:MAG: ATP-binding protein, partial [Holophagales bacterium]|nr:ATP-binding protein [Holophagales bacterium]
MLTKLTIRNFKRFEEVEIELGSAVVLIGPNNSGKTSAMQALALWDIGLRRWLERRSGGSAPEKRPGVTVNRRDLVAIPVPNANLLWRDLHTRHVHTVDGRQRTDNVCIDVIVQGTSSAPASDADEEQGVSGDSEAGAAGRPWRCGLEFDYANQESFYCRPLRLERGPAPPRMPVPEEAMARK